MWVREDVREIEWRTIWIALALRGSVSGGAAEYQGIAASLLKVHGFGWSRLVAATSRRDARMRENNVRDITSTTGREANEYTLDDQSASPFHVHMRE
jgi:hypothetical protein